MSEPDIDAYALKTAVAAEVAAPELAYRPPLPKAYRPRIALVGAGGISAAHLDAYRSMGLDVAVIANRTLSKAEAKRESWRQWPMKAAFLGAGAAMPPVQPRTKQRNALVSEWPTCFQKCVSNSFSPRSSSSSDRASNSFSM